jgi:hypothetical protein
MSNEQVKAVVDRTHKVLERGRDLAKKNKDAELAVQFMALIVQLHGHSTYTDEEWADFCATGEE